MLKSCILNGNRVEYDTEEFKVCSSSRGNYLWYTGSGKCVKNPKGNISCFQMFERFNGESLDLSSFNTRNIKDMTYMFCGTSCRFFDLSGFDTRHLTAEDFERFGYLFFDSFREDFNKIIIKINVKNNQDLLNVNFNINEYQKSNNFNIKREGSTIISTFDDGINSVIVATILDTNNEIQREIDKLVKENKNVLVDFNYKAMGDVYEVAKRTNTNFNDILVELIKSGNSLDIVDNFLDSFCDKINSVMFKGNSSISSYSVSEIAEILYKKYNKVLVDAALVKYLGSYRIEL